MAEIKLIAENVEISVGQHKMKVKLLVNEYGNLQVVFSQEDLKKMPDGYCTEGLNDEILIYPFKR